MQEEWAIFIFLQLFFWQTLICEQKCNSFPVKKSSELRGNAFMFNVLLGQNVSFYCPDAIGIEPRRIDTA